MNLAPQRGPHRPISDRSPHSGWKNTSAADARGRWAGGLPVTTGVRGTLTARPRGSGWARLEWTAHDISVFIRRCGSVHLSSWQRRAAALLRLVLDAAPWSLLHERGQRLWPVLSGGQQLSAQQGHCARWLRVAALLRSVGQIQRSTEQIGLLLLPTQRSERPVGCTQRSGISEEQRRNERRSFGVGFLGLVAFVYFLRTFMYVTARYALY